MDRIIFYCKSNWIIILMIILAVYDLRIDIRLLFDHFTFSLLFITIFEHPLAIIVLTTAPTLFISLKK